MEFRIADTFIESLTRLTGEEQKAVKTTAFDLQLSPANPGMSFHKLDRARDKNFWSVRAGSDIRLIVHRRPGSTLLCYVDHHDKAYEWAERRKLESHPKTGAAQLVEIRETVKELFVPLYRESGAVNRSKTGVRKGRLFADASDDQLLGYGVPPEWVDDVRNADEDALLSLADHLPSEAVEALFDEATKGRNSGSDVFFACRRSIVRNPEIVEPALQPANPLNHAHARRRFQLISTPEELQRALDGRRWVLHPEQRRWAESSFISPCCVSGSAGTGKTVLALHRAAHLARTYPGARILLTTTCSDMVACMLQANLRQLLGGQDGVLDRINVCSLSTLGLTLHRSIAKHINVAAPELIHEFIREAASELGGSFDIDLLFAEWETIIDDVWQVSNWDEYWDAVSRSNNKGFKARPGFFLSAWDRVRAEWRSRYSQSKERRQRKQIWAIFERVQARLSAHQLITQDGAFVALAATISRADSKPFHHVVVDDAQDLSIPQLLFLAVLGRGQRDGLFLTTDPGQRILQQPLPWEDFCGAAKVVVGTHVFLRPPRLTVNFRNSASIRSLAERLLDPMRISGTGYDRSLYAAALFDCAPPAVISFKSESEELKAVGDWIRTRVREGIKPCEIGIFVRTASELHRAFASIKGAGLSFQVLDEKPVLEKEDHIWIGTMPLSKGLELRAAAVMAFDEGIVPLQQHTDVVDAERNLLYIACTRARDHLMISGVEPISKILRDA